MSDVDNKVKMIVEGLLLAAGRPLSLDNIAQVFTEEERPDKQELKTVMASIAQGCDDRGFELNEVASGYRFQVKQEISEWVAKLWEERPPRYTRALLETLALVAYRQPITRGDIEEIRGVGVSSNIIRTLLDREWIRVVGHRDVPGRPAMFATTKQFLDYFNLKNLQDLPPLSEVRELESVNQEVDKTDGLAEQRVLELPEEVVDENSFELTGKDKEDLLAEEEAVALSQKPLDEILNFSAEEEKENDVDALLDELAEEDRRNSEAESEEKDASEELTDEEPITIEELAGAFNEGALPDDSEIEDEFDLGEELTIELDEAVVGATESDDGGLEENTAEDSATKEEPTSNSEIAVEDDSSADDNAEEIEFSVGDTEISATDDSSNLVEADKTDED